MLGVVAGLTIILLQAEQLLAAVVLATIQILLGNQEPQEQLI
jgi:hypothetical protein